MQEGVLVKIKDKTMGWYLGGHMDQPADSTAKLCQGGKSWYVGREGIPMDDSSGKECEYYSFH